MLPRIALVDPELTYKSATGNHGKLRAGRADTIDRAICFSQSKPDDRCDLPGRDASACGASLRRAYENGADKEARQGMSLASLFGGLALANAALGAVHGFAGPLGGMLHAPHGALCARLLPFVMEANLKALETRQA